MNENINLCEILKGHEREIFYSPAFGKVQLKGISYNSIDFIPSSDYEIVRVDERGIFLDGGECCIFPSKDQRDWNKWAEENKKTPKTWSELCKKNPKFIGTDYCIDLTSIRKDGWTRRNTPIEKSALALLKIYQLIEVGYSENVTNEEWYDDLVPKYIIIEKSKNVFKSVCVRKFNNRTPIAFHTEEQAEKFLSYPENIQLLKDYFMNAS